MCGYTNDENLCQFQKCLKGNAKNTQYSLILPKKIDKVLALLQNNFGFYGIHYFSFIRPSQKISYYQR